MRVALFGGSFDPPHRGHLAIAAAAADALGLDSVLFAPVGRQPFKLESMPTAYADRLAMVSAACETDGRFAASTLDAPRVDGGPNYTVDTLIRLREEMPEARIYSLVGADSFLGLPHWHESERLLELAEWIVVSRPGFPLEGIDGARWVKEHEERIHRIESVHEDVAATDLRRRLEAGEACEDLLPAAVSAYIREHHLYC
jgi:nicotinate-nucleotide adenylyltransferase